jgi:hypothetical protein
MTWTSERFRSLQASGDHQFVRINISPAGFLRLLIRNLMAAPDELRRPALSHHIIQTQDNYHCFKWE